MNNFVIDQRTLFFSNVVDFKLKLLQDIRL